MPPEIESSTPAPAAPTAVTPGESGESGSRPFARSLPSSSDDLKSSRQVLVWDLLVRLFHWALVASFFTGFFITSKFPFHAYTGYTIVTLVVIRIVWGFVGSKYARFSAFTYSIQETLRYTMSALRMGEAREYLSHNPMGSIMVYAMLTLLLANGTIGIMLYGAQQLEGPLEGIVPTDWDETLLTIHHIMARVLISLAGLHIVGVIWASYWHRRNYVLAMLTGYKSGFTRRARRRSGGWPEEP